MLHQQTSMCSPMSPILGTQNLIDNPSSQLLRSKSLNDISNNLLETAPDLSINFHNGLQQQQIRQASNHILDTVGSNLIAPYDTNKQLTGVAVAAIHHPSNGTTCMNVVNCYDHDIYQPQPNLNNSYTTPAQSNNNAFNDHLVNGQINQQQATIFHSDPNDNQCSNRQNTSSLTTSATNIFNTCNPIVMNLNGVTEQIGNLHL